MTSGVPRLRRLVRAGLVSTAAAAMLVSAAGGMTTQQRVADLLAQAQSLLREGRTEAALELLDQASSAAQESAGLQLSMREELLWQRAMATLDFVSEFSNVGQARQIAARARLQWVEYPEWYQALTHGELAALPPQNRRIHKATAFLGIAGLRAHAWRDVLRDYANITDLTLLGPDAVENWKAALYRCADGKDPERSAEVRRRKVCDEACAEYWQVYAATLKEWAAVFQLRPAVRQSHEREAWQIEAIAAACQQAAPGGEP